MCRFQNHKTHVLAVDFKVVFSSFSAVSTWAELHESLRMDHFTLSFQLLVLCCCAVCGAEISCKNEDGEPVDWWVLFSSMLMRQKHLCLCFYAWKFTRKDRCFSISILFRFIIYKLPRYINGGIGSGVAYMYLDSSKEGWQMSKYMINSSQGAIANTLNQLYMGKEYKVRSGLYVGFYVLSEAFGSLKGITRDDARASLLSRNSFVSFEEPHKLPVCTIWRTVFKVIKTQSKIFSKVYKSTYQHLINSLIKKQSGGGGVTLWAVRDWGEDGS